MSSDSIHNGVFSGKNALLNYYNPDHNPPTPMVELPDHPYIPDGVRIYAKLMNFLPAGNVKSLPALNMLQKGLHEQEINAGTDTVVEYSSGSTALSLGIISKILGIDRAEIYITNKTTQTKINMLRLFGLELTVFGGPSQPAMDDPIGGIAAARDRGAHPGCFNPDQYDNPANFGAHVKWTGPQIYQQLPQIKVFAAPGGTTGTLTGTSTYLKGVKPEIMSVAAFTASGERVPGPRTLGLTRDVKFPWKQVTDEIIEIGAQEAFDHSLLLCRKGIVVGPSSGMSLAAVYSFLERRKSLGSLDELRDEQGEITCVFMCCDFPFQYVDEYIQKCSPGLFPPIHNQELLKVDLNPYLLEWELQPLEAKKMMCGGSGDTHQDEVMVLDLRNVAAFKNSSILNSISIDVRLGLDDPNPFSSAAELIELHKQLALSFQAPNGKLFKTLYTFGRTKARVVVVCQNGTACRTATSVMRSKGIEAYCIIGGIDGWLRAGLPLHTRSFNRSSLYPTTTQCPLEVILSSAYLANPPLVPDPTLVHH
ncbi:hypothetical protein H4Q26_007641 [Puccinia striiformis f. sp. tritici PST-130]|uniref:Rhodanese domain-containing protein n=1 Tax=Puccinia striiformis f. sp. tritici PST-78 TaxID=1165861 RepID=A0A0L0V991_9BASI|nr:hypothetical protein Pst134EB_021676 [Puccinia striiformis f. sp. tritici]KAI9612485.1 hypothetical protein H4Q26_007641 [Puccinia striiformis f. sp. tritici PST-130]KNE95857.1 hypothetical protein PSTG_10775 [Puccinia striiformis f. sp. tritici PST-78]